MLLFWRSWAALTRRSRTFEAGKGHGGFITRGNKVMTPILSLHQNWLCQDLWWFTMIYTFSIVYIYIYLFIYLFIYLLISLQYSVFIYCLCRGGITGVASPGWHHLLDLFVLCHPDHQGFRNTTNATATDVECSSQHSCSWWERTAMEGCIHWLDPLSFRYVLEDCWVLH